ncbi:MAG: MATE family efflux transporter [Acutalibacteraceae bacterium]
MLVKDKKFYRGFFSMTMTIALQNLIVYGVNLADNIMLGAYSETALSGVAIANQVQFLLQMIVTGTASGMGVIVSQYWGKRQTEPIRRVFAVGFWISLILSAVMSAVVWFLPYGVMGLLTNEQAIIPAGVQYLKIMVFSYLIFSVSNSLLGVMRSVETVHIGFYISLATLFINVFLNYMLIYGRFGAPELGVKGAAYATLTSRVVEFAAIVVYCRFIDKKLRLNFRDIFALERSYIRDFFRSGVPLMLSSVSWGVAMSVQAAILGRLGASGIAASSIAQTLFQCTSVVAYATGDAARVMTGMAVGEGDMEKIRSEAKTMQLLFLIIGVITSAVLFAVRKPIISVYNTSPETSELANVFVLILCVTSIGTAYEMPCLTGIVSGGGDTKFVFLNDIVFMWCIVLPLSALSAFCFKFPPAVTFALLKADQILKCFVALVKVNRFRWVRVLTR